MPANCVHCARPGKLGNPFTIEDAVDAGYVKCKSGPDANQFVVDCFRDWLTGTGDDWWAGKEANARRIEILAKLPKLRGKDLACWCPLDQPCHVDVLLELANA